MYFYCIKCKKKYPLTTHAYKCSCGGLFDLYKTQQENISSTLTLGEGETPLLPINIGGLEFHCKMENLQPTGSFKDRGSSVLISELKKLGITEVVEDSYGNAGVSLAAYAAAAGMKCTIYLPKNTNEAKIRQIKAYGAEIVLTENGRKGACKDVKEHGGDAYYASHVYNPLFMAGVKTMAKEIYAQLHNSVPEYIALPAGNGTLLLGLYYGFMELGRLPRFLVVQPTNCAPLYEAYHQRTAPKEEDETLALMNVSAPSRLEEMLAAVRNSQGDVVAVSAEEIRRAMDLLGKKGIYSDVITSTTLAGALKFFKDGKPDNYRVILPVTGTGLRG